MSAHQYKMVTLDELVSKNHQYRKFNKLLDFSIVQGVLSKVETPNNYKGYGVLRLFKCLLLQFMEDMSDRELEMYLSDSTSAKWFCEFNLGEKTPDYTVFSKMRARIGTSTLSQIFAQFRDQLKSQGYIGEVFTFVDATHLISKAALWEERDEARRRKYEKLNNETLPKVSKDKDARIGCKGKDKFWYGFKKHVSVDMRHGLINKVAITPANVTDSKGFKHVAPNSGATYADKAYCDKNAKQTAKAKGLHLAAVKKNNMKDKNKDLDKYYTKTRAPFENVFSKDNKRARYKGIAKNQFAAFMQSLCFNLKRLLVITSPPKNLALQG